MPTNPYLWMFLSLCMTYVALPACDPLCQNMQIKQDHNRLVQMNTQLERQIADIERDLVGLQSDRYAEHVVRDELGYGRATDVTLVF